MRIAIIGTGGVGGYYGAHLAAAGNEVVFIARGTQYDALKSAGLEVISPTRPLTLSAVEVYRDPAEAPKADIALSCVKLYDAEHGAAMCAAVLKPDGLAVSLQNGIDGPKILAEHVGHERAIAGSVIISAFVSRPGVIEHVGSEQAIVLERRGEHSARLFERCNEAGFSARQIDDPAELLWRKFVRLVPLSGISALCRSPMGVVRSTPHLRRTLFQLVEETAGIGRALGVRISDSIADEVVARIDDSPFDFKPSLLLDLERGNRLEAPWLAGRVVGLGEELGIPTPFNSCVWSALLPYVDGAPG